MPHLLSPASTQQTLSTSPVLGSAWVLEGREKPDPCLHGIFKLSAIPLTQRNSFQQFPFQGHFCKTWISALCPLALKMSQLKSHFEELLRKEVPGREEPPFTNGFMESKIPEFSSVEALSLLSSSLP